MAKPSERVQLLKQEVALDGGDPADIEDGFPAPANSEEDAIQVAGVYYGEAGVPASDTLVADYRENGERVFEDTEHLANDSRATTLAFLSGLRFAMFTTEGGLVYDSASHPILKAVP